MKKVYISIASLLLLGNVMMAQSPANRTAQTVVADVLAQMPAQQQAEYNKMINDLATTGEAGVAQLISQINAPGKGSNAKVDYALSGLSHFVMAKGNEQARQTVEKAYINALSQVSERETKAFIIRQLQIIGSNQSIDVLDSYLNDRELSGPAARALQAIGSEEAKQVLLASIQRRAGTPQTQQDAIRALAGLHAAEAEPVLLAMLGNEDPDMQKTVLYALSQCGSAASLKDLANAAAAVNYRMERTGANEAYIALIKRVGGKDAEKAAADLMKKAAKAGARHTREAALEILFAQQPNNTNKLLQTALKDADKDYRNAALRFASVYANQALYVEVMKGMMKAKPEVKVDVLNWIGRESKNPKQHDVIKNLEIRFDLPARQVILNQLNDANFDVRQAAVWALVKIGDKSVIPALADLLKHSDKQDVLLGEDALMAFSGDIDQAVAKVIPDASEAGKIAGLELLANRKADANLNTVLDQIKSGTPAVKKAAYTALKDVVAEKDFTQLCGMLETADADAIAPIQDAIVVSIAKQPAQTKVQNVNRRMVQAGDSKKHLYYKVLSATGEAEALQTIVKGFMDGKGAAKDAALEALLVWNGVDAADPLFVIAKNTTSDEVHTKALTRYVALVSTPSLTGENRLIRLRKAMDIAKSGSLKALVLKQVQQTGTFIGMMYAAKFMDDSNADVRSAATYAVWNIARSHTEYTGKDVKALLTKVLGQFDGQDASYDRDAVKQHLEKMSDEAGFVSLFNGQDLTGWKGMVGKDGDGNPYKRYKMTPAKLAQEQKAADERMRKDWFAKDGCIVFEGSGYDNLCTEKVYGDFEMYVDWMLDPTGKEPDAGIYLRATPQVQIWDTSRVNVGAQVGSGGLYNNKVNERNPLKVADNKLGEWNSFYIKMVGDRVTVKLNGELVVDNVIMENYWDRSQPILPVEQIELQAHGSRCYFRDIYVKELPKVEPFQLSDQEKKEGFKVLFDGSNMHEWTGNTVDYILEDGCISCVPTKSFGGNLYTKQEYGNFIYRFDFQLTPGANNGIGIRTPMEGDAAYVGMEIQVLDCEHPIYKNITPLQHHGSVYGIIPANTDHHSAFKPVGEWNTEEIIANGDNIKVTVNGQVILEGNIREATKNGTADHKEHPGLFNKKGHIGFLGHGSPVKFRNIRIKELK